jgi:hypothetical protein
MFRRRRSNKLIKENTARISAETNDATAANYVAILRNVSSKCAADCIFFDDLFLPPFPL